VRLHLPNFIPFNISMICEENTYSWNIYFSEPVYHITCCCIVIKIFISWIAGCFSVSGRENFCVRQNSIKTVWKNITPPAALYQTTTSFWFLYFNIIFHCQTFWLRKYWTSTTFRFILPSSIVANHNQNFYWDQPYLN